MVQWVNVLAAKPDNSSQVNTSINLAHGRLRQEYHQKSEVSVGYFIQARAAITRLSKMISAPHSKDSHIFLRLCHIRPYHIIVKVSLNGVSHIEHLIITVFNSIKVDTVTIDDTIFDLLHDLYVLV